LLACSRRRGRSTSFRRAVGRCRFARNHTPEPARIDASVAVAAGVIVGHRFTFTLAAILPATS
jgi:hypothetical protein